jgi:probable F420-dependent oxidoreductase
MPSAYFNLEEERRMRFGLQWFVTDETPTPQEVAPLVEQRGFESLLVTEHTHIPVSRRSPPPDGTAELGRHYLRTLDPFVALTAAAMVTERLVVGTGILLVGQRDPIVTAKAAASVDLLSRGRLLLGVGAGWNIEELEHHGVSERSRFSVMKEHVDAMRALWVDEEASYGGRHVAFAPSWAWPKPARAIPIVVGGNGPRVLDRVIDFGDEWGPGDAGPEAMLPRLEELRRRSEEAERPPVPTTLFVAPADPTTLERYEDAGVHRAVYALPSVTSLGEVERELDRLADVIDAYDHRGSANRTAT